MRIPQFILVLIFSGAISCHFASEDKAITTDLVNSPLTANQLAEKVLIPKIKMDEEGYIVVTPGTTKTNKSGIFAAGDCVDKTFRQAVTAAGLGCMSALETEKYLASIED